MRSTTRVLDALKSANMITSWKWIDEGEGKFKERVPLVISDQLSVSDETYGASSFLYFRCRSKDVAQRAAQIIRDLGGHANFGWCKDHPECFESQVSYFKGSRHWE